MLDHKSGSFTHTHTHTHTAPRGAAARTSQALSCHRGVELAIPSAGTFIPTLCKPSFFLPFTSQPQCQLFKELFLNHPLSSRSPGISSLCTASQVPVLFMYLLMALFYSSPHSKSLPLQRQRDFVSRFTTVSQL